MDLARAVVSERGHALKAVARALGVARSTLHYRAKECRLSRTRPEHDAPVLADIRCITDDRPSYGYRRVTAMLRQLGHPPTNHKRVYRLMKENQLLLERFTGKPRRVHEGVIRTLKSDVRWCSDIFEVACRSGEHVQVAFTLDCCDREVIGHIATTSFITGEMIRDMLTECIERRFGKTLVVPQPLEFLTDNGSVYTAIETREMLMKAGVTPCTTPVYSPESNGMAESFVKGFKRDYVYLNSVDTAADVLNALPAWFVDYNEVRPHKGLKMLPPAEFRRRMVAC